MQRTVDTFLERIEGPGKPVVGAFSAEWLGEAAWQRRFRSFFTRFVMIFDDFC